MQLPYNFHARTKLPTSLLAFFLTLAVIAPLSASAAAIDFTRHFSRHDNSTAEAAANQDAFTAVPGDARLIVTSSSDEASATIELNGATVAGADKFGSAGQFEVPVTLVKNNNISVTYDGAPQSSVSVRIKQVADIELHITSRLHFNANVSNFAASSEFFGKLGFGTLTGFPDTNTVEMAQAMGVETPTSYDGSKGEEAGGYLLHGELLSPSLMKWGGVALEGGLIDLIEFTIPRNEEPPYARLNHLGLARAAMYTADIKADYEYMKSIGVRFISAPATRSDGRKFAIFTDLDGTYFELVEKAGKDVETEDTHIFRLAHINVNVSDFERSRAWYQMFGYEVSQELPATDSIEVANAMGFAEQIETRGAMLTHPGDGSMLELVQWIAPYNPERAYDIPANHLGIARIAFATSDMEADVAALKSQGVQFLSDITPCCQGPDSSGSIVAFYDPDGAIIELAEQDFMSMLSMMFNWLYDQIFN